MDIRTARISDAASMATVMNEIIRIGGTTAYRGDFDADRISKEFIERPQSVGCFVATERGGVLGFQSLTLVLRFV